MLDIHSGTNQHAFNTIYIIRSTETNMFFYTRCNINFQYTNPLPFETEPHYAEPIQTIRILREHADSLILFSLIQNTRYNSISNTFSNYF